MPLVCDTHIAGTNHSEIRDSAMHVEVFADFTAKYSAIISLDIQYVTICNYMISIYKMCILNV